MTCGSPPVSGSFCSVTTGAGWGVASGLQELLCAAKSQQQVLSSAASGSAGTHKLPESSRAELLLKATCYRRRNAQKYTAGRKEAREPGGSKHAEGPFHTLTFPGSFQESLQEQAQGTSCSSVYRKERLATFIQFLCRQNLKQQENNFEAHPGSNPTPTQTNT